MTRIITGIVLMAALFFSSYSPHAAEMAPGTDSPRQLAIELGAPFCDNMVLQREMAVPWSKPGTRIVECALPWSEIPHVKQLRDAGKPVKFSLRVNHQTRGPDMELPVGRSAAEGLSPSFHPNWVPHWPNELEFGFE